MIFYYEFFVLLEHSRKMDLDEQKIFAAPSMFKNLYMMKFSSFVKLHNPTAALLFSCIPTVWPVYILATLHYIWIRQRKAIKHA
jgi:hypothetical protein